MIINKVNWPEFFAQYTSGIALSKLCQQWHVSVPYAKRKMRKRGVHIRSISESRRMASKQVRLTKEYPLTELAAAYNGGMPVRQICKEFHLHSREAKRLLKQAGVKYRSLSEARAQVMQAIPAADREARLQAMRNGWSAWRSQVKKSPPVRAG